MASKKIISEESKTYFKQLYGSSPTLTFQADTGSPTTITSTQTNTPASPTLMSRLRLSSDVPEDMVQIAIDVCKANGLLSPNDKTYRLSKKK